MAWNGKTLKNWLSVSPLGKESTEVICIRTSYFELGAISLVFYGFIFVYLQLVSFFFASEVFYDIRVC